MFSSTNQHKKFNIPKQLSKNVFKEIFENKCLIFWWCKQCSHGQVPKLMQVQMPDVTAVPVIIVAPRKKGRSSG